MRFGLEEEEIENICKILTIYPSIEKATIYGSRAMGNYKEGSDIDLCLYGKNINLSLLAEIELSLDDLYLPYTFDLSNFESIKNRNLISHIERRGKIFYSRDIPKQSTESL